MYKRILRVKRIAALEAAAAKINVTVRRSRRSSDAPDCYVIEGPDSSAKAIDKLVTQFDGGAK